MQHTVAVAEEDVRLLEKGWMPNSILTVNVHILDFSVFLKGG